MCLRAKFTPTKRRCSAERWRARAQAWPVKQRLQQGDGDPGMSLLCFLCHGELVGRTKPNQAIKSYQNHQQMVLHRTGCWYALSQGTSAVRSALYKDLAFHLAQGKHTHLLFSYLSI